jgi:hypothetical protein
MARVTPDDLWIFIYEKGHVRTRDLQNQYVKTKQLSRGTLYKYKRQLEHEGKIQTTTIHAKPPYNLYSVPSEYHQEIEALAQYKRLPFPSRSALFNVEALPWEDTPPGLFFTDVKRKVLWTNEETSAILVLLKAQPGIIEPLHYHPQANKWAYFLSGEIELPDGTPMPVSGLCGFIPKGELHTSPKVRKESIVLCYFDGPRTKVPVSNLEEEERAKLLWSGGLLHFLKRDMSGTKKSN